MSVAALKAALRKCTPVPSWNAGERAYQTGRVALRSSEDDGSEYVFAVTIGPSVAEVTLWPEDADWEVEPEPPSRGSPHAVAALLALEGGLDSVEAADAPPRLVVVLTSHQDRLLVGAEVDREGERENVRWPLPGRIEAGPQLLHLLRTANSWLSGQVPPRAYRALLQGLLEADAVELDGAPLKVTRKPLDMVAAVDRFGTSCRLRLEDDPSVTHVFEGEPTLVLAPGQLQPRGYGRLTELERHRLGKPVLYGPHELGMLTARRLPDLERSIRVVRREGVPETTDAGLVVRLDVLATPGGLELTGRVVYGEPPIAELMPQGCVPLGGFEQIPSRDLNQERLLIDQLRRELGLSPGARRLLQGADAARFVRDRVPKFTGAVHGRDVVKRFSVRGDLAPHAAWTGERLDLQFTVDGALVGAERVLRAWRAGDDLVALPGGGYAPLPTDWLDEFGEAAEVFLDAGGGGPLPRHLAHVAAALAPEVPPDVRGLVDLLRGAAGVPDRRPPDGLKAVLRDYQQVGWSWLAAMNEQQLGCVLADDMGLGKTVQALALLLAVSSARPALVVAPRSVLRNWQQEAQRFSPELRVGLLHGPGRSERLAELAAGELDVLVTTYAVLRLDVEELRTIELGAVVLDEAQAIKNPDSQTARAARTLRARHRIALTGTPVENHLGELWSLFEFLNPGFFGGRGRFDATLGGPAAAGDPRAIRSLRARVKPFILRRLKSEVAAELPPRTDVVLRCPMSEVQKAGYERARTGGLSSLAQDDRRPRRMRVLEILTRLRQASCHAGLLPGGDPSAPSGKLDVLCETLAEVIDEGHRALVFSQWTSLLDLVEPRLLDLGLGFLRLDGSTRNRAELVEQYQAPDGPPVFLISLKAGGTGLNLTAADHVFHLDPWWNPAVEQQATDRAHRIGQERPVIAWKLVAEGTVEERIVALQERKRALAESVLQGQGVATLSDADLDALLDPLGG